MRNISEKTRRLVGNYVLLSQTEDSWLILSKNDNQVIHLSKSAHHEIFNVLTGGDISRKDTERIINLDSFKRLVSSDEDSDVEAAKNRLNSERMYPRFVIQPNTDEMIDGEIRERYDIKSESVYFKKGCSQTEATKIKMQNVELDYDSGITDHGERSDDSSNNVEESDDYIALSESPAHTKSDLFHMLTNMNNAINFNDGMNYSLVIFNVHRVCHLLNEKISQMPNNFTQSLDYASFGIAFFNELVAAFEYLDVNFPSGNFDVDGIVSDIHYLTEMKTDIESILRKGNTYLTKKGSIQITEELLSRADLIKQKYFNRFPFCPADNPFYGKSGDIYDKMKKLHEDHWILVKRGVYCQQPEVSLQPKFAKHVEVIRSRLDIREVDRCLECNILLSETEFAVLRDCDHVICLRCAELHSSKLATKSMSTWCFHCPVCEAKVRAWTSSLHFPASRPNLLSRIKPLASLLGAQVLFMVALYGLVKKGVLTK